MAATVSISIGIDNDQGFIGLGQDPSLAISSGDGVTPPVMRVQSTDSLHDDKQLLGDPTGKSVDFSESPPRFTSVREENDAASFVNEITQGDVGTFSDTSTGFETAAILPRLFGDPIVAATSSVSFSDDIPGNRGDTSFGGVSGVTLRDRGDLKLPGRFQSSPSKQLSSSLPKSTSSNSPVLVRLLRIQQVDITITICGGKFGKIGLHAYSSPVSMDNACGIKAHVIKVQAFFEIALYIRTPSKTSQCTVYMIP